MNPSLSTLSVVLGLVVAGLNLSALFRPEKSARMIRKFPRSVPAGTVLMLVSTAWFVWNVKKEPIADFESMKPVLIALFIAVGVGACIFVRDHLGARGLAVFMLMLASLMLDTARWSETAWRLVIVVWAYLFVVAGVWLTVSPHRLRDMIEWCTGSEKRMRLLCGIRAAFGVFVVVLGVTVFRG